MHQFLNYFGLIEHQFLAKREVPSGGKLLEKMFHNTLEKFEFWGVLSCNELRGVPEKLSTEGTRNCGKLSRSRLGRWAAISYFCTHEN